MTAFLSRFSVVLAVLFAFCSLIAFQPSAPQSGHLSDPFSTGWILTDTNGDGIVDFIAGKVAVPARASAADNAAAADIAARLRFATTGFTPPIVISGEEDRSDGPRVDVGRDAAPSRYTAAIIEHANRWQPEEGGVFAIDNNLIVLNRTEREQTGKVAWRVERLLPNLPANEPEPPRQDATTAGSN
jgi:hypothetical protein